MPPTKTRLTHDIGAPQPDERDTPPRNRRSAGTNPRALGTNPRARRGSTTSRRSRPTREQRAQIAFREARAERARAQAEQIRRGPQPRPVHPERAELERVKARDLESRIASRESRNVARQARLDRGRQITSNERRARAEKGFRGVKAFAVGNPRRSLFAAMLTLVVLEVGDDIMRGESPRPGEFAVPFAAYLMLALVAELGEGPAKTAAAMGWLVVVVSALNRVRNNPTDNLFTNLVKFAGRGPQTPVGSKQTQPVGGGPAAGTMSGNIDTYV